MRRFFRRSGKYNNRKVEIDGHTFDSQLEADFYESLKLQMKAGKVMGIEVHPSFVLQESFDRYSAEDGKTHRIRPIVYVADFRVFPSDRNRKDKVYDCKGVKTEVYKLKKKLLLYKYPNLDFVEITRKDLK